MKTDTNQEIERPAKRRARTAAIGFDRVWRLLTRKHPMQFMLVDEFDLPADCRVITVHPDPCLGAFVFILESEQFDEIPEGIRPPEIEVKSRVVELAIKEKETET